MKLGAIDRMGKVWICFLRGFFLSHLKCFIKLRLSTQSLKCDFKLFPIHLTQQIELQPHINTVEMGD